MGRWSGFLPGSIVRPGRVHRAGVGGGLLRCSWPALMRRARSLWRRKTRPSARSGLSLAPARSARLWLKWCRNRCGRASIPGWRLRRD